MRPGSNANYRDLQEFQESGPICSGLVGAYFEARMDMKYAIVLLMWSITARNIFCLFKL